MIINIDFHGVPLTFDCDVIFEPAEKDKPWTPGCAAEATVMVIRFEGREIDPDNEVWEAICRAVNASVRKR